MATIEDLVNTTASQSGEGLEVQRSFHVTDIPGNANAKPTFALNADKIPNLGDPHPSDGTLFAVSKNVSFIDSDNARVTVNYRIPRYELGDPPPGGAGPTQAPPDSQKGTITVGSSLSSGETNVDRKGKQLIVDHKVLLPEILPADFTGPPELVLTIVEQVRTVSIQRPQAVIRVQRVEAGNPSVKARNFVGTVNNRAISSSTLDGPRFWLCTRVDGVSNDGGFLFNVTYEFQHNRNRWMGFVEWIDPETGLPVPAADRNSGGEIALYEIYPETDFRQLNIFFE